MAVTITSASDRRSLLAALKSFCTGLGWTAVYDAISSKGQLGLSKGNCFLSIGEYRDSGDTTSPNTTVTDAVAGTLNDYYLVAALNTSLTAGNTKYWGHPGGNGYADSDLVTINDMTGPFSTVWFFSNATGDYVHVVVLSAPNRYSHFSFGTLDKAGMTHSDVAFLTGTYYHWWTFNSNPAFAVNNEVGHNNHLIGYNYPIQHANIPSTVPNPSLGFSTGRVTHWNGGQWSWTQFYRQRRSDHYGGFAASGYMLSVAFSLMEDQVTGGVRLWSKPVVQRNSANTNYMFLGLVPDLFDVSMENHAGGEVITLGSDDYYLFPIKQVGAENNASQGAVPMLGCNTTFNGIAIKDA